MPAGLEGLLSSGASLTFLRLAFPDRVLGVQRWLAKAGLVAAVGVVGTSTMESLQNWRHGRTGNLKARDKERFWTKYKQKLRVNSGTNPGRMFWDRVGATEFLVADPQ